MKRNKQRYKVLFVSAMILAVIFHASIVLGATRLVPSVYATIQAAIDDADPGDTVLVADGTYTGDGNVEVDFGGKAITVESENGPGNCTIDGEDTFVRAFIFETNEGPNSILSGFTITNFGLNGIRCVGSSPTITNCSFIGNGDGHMPGDSAIFLWDSSSPTITYCNFTGNVAENGGGIRASNNCSPTISYCTFTGNGAPMMSGGAMSFGSGSPIITSCMITGNTAAVAGGIAIWGSSAIIRNCVISANTSTAQAGAIQMVDGSVTITNCTITGNVADLAGNGIPGGAISKQRGSLTVTNCIMWNDTPDEIYVYEGTAPVVTYSDVDGAGVYTGDGNINQAPLFVGGEDLHLQASSPCIDAGNDSAPSLPGTDIDGESRIVDVPPPDVDSGSVDMGADEFLDSDGDGVPDRIDGCPDDPNKPDPGICGCGVADTDSDSDGTPDCNDVCPNDNDNDVDGDGVCGDVDNCPDTPNANQTDSDTDTVGNACDACPNDNDNDIDRDGVCGDVDNCLDSPNADQADSDGDGIGDACELDADADGYTTTIDCDDNNAAINPGAVEWCNDGIDNDCDGFVDSDDSQCDDDNQFPTNCFINTAVSTSLGM